jgi:hypothetical protein
VQQFCIHQYIMPMPPQIKRLIPLFIIFITLFLVVRSLLIPDSFGQYGHYRGDALLENEAKEVVFADREDCVACHWDIQEILESDAHAHISCLTCHGPGQSHVEDPQIGNITRESSREFCGRCHDIHAARPAGVVVQVDVATHNIEGVCIDCHNPHKVREGLE